MKSITYSALISLRNSRSLVKDFVYFTESGIYIANSEKSFSLYNNALGSEVIISNTEPNNPKNGTIWIDTSDI